VKYVSDAKVMIGSIFLEEMNFFRELDVSAELLVFGERLFVVKC
jgi:hypothetical protein